MTLNIEKMRKDMAWENRKFAVSFTLAIAAALGAGVALANYVNGRPLPPQPPQTIIIQQQPPPPASSPAPK